MSAGEGYGDNLGEGKGFRFYANPAGPTGTGVGADAVQLTAYQVNASAPNPDGNTTVSYTISVFPQGSLRPVRSTATSGPTVNVSRLAPGTYVPPRPGLWLAGGGAAVMLLVAPQQLVTTTRGPAPITMSHSHWCVSLRSLCGNRPRGASASSSLHHSGSTTWPRPILPSCPPAPPRRL